MEREVSRTRILFVCLGNICRSPMAKWVFADLVKREGLARQFEIDSCGTGAWHIGEAADPRAAAAGRGKGLDVRHTARQVCEADYAAFDFIIVMDRKNRADVLAAGAPAEKVHLMRSFDPALHGRPEHEMDVPDPYWGGEEGFERVHQMLARAARGLLGELRLRGLVHEHGEHKP
jgi:protein-tyrosine phosphatase